MIDPLTSKILARLGQLQLAAQLLSMIEHDVEMERVEPDAQIAEATIALATRCSWHDLSSDLKTAYNRQSDNLCYKWYEIGGKQPVPSGCQLLVRHGNSGRMSIREPGEAGWPAGGTHWTRITIC